MSEAAGIAGVVAARLNRHALARPYGESVMWCVCLTWSADRTSDRIADERSYESHVADDLAAAVLDHLRAVAADEAVRERVWEAVADVRDAYPRRPDDADTHDVLDAALAAFLAALGGDGGGMGPVDALEGPRSDDEGPGRASGHLGEGQDGSGLVCLAVVPPGWPPVKCVRPFGHEGEHSPTPKWVDLFGMAPDFTGGQDVNEYLDESRGEA